MSRASLLHGLSVAPRAGRSQPSGRWPCALRRYPAPGTSETAQRLGQWNAVPRRTCSRQPGYFVAFAELVVNDACDPRRGPAKPSTTRIVAASGGGAGSGHPCRTSAHNSASSGSSSVQPVFSTLIATR